MRSPGHALTCAALETWPGRRGDAQTQTPSHWPARLRFRGPPSWGRGGAAGASQRACASRVSRINWTQRKGQRNEKEIKRRFTTTVKNLQSGAGMEFHATEPAPTGPRGQAGPFLPAPRESRPPSRPALVESLALNLCGAVIRNATAVNWEPPCRAWRVSLGDRRKAATPVSAAASGRASALTWTLIHNSQPAGGRREAGSFRWLCAPHTYNLNVYPPGEAAAFGPLVPTGANPPA